jgi:hypothetical protein
MIVKNKSILLEKILLILKNMKRALIRAMSEAKQGDTSIPLFQVSFYLFDNLFPLLDVNKTFELHVTSPFDRHDHGFCGCKIFTRMQPPKYCTSQ